MILSTTKTIGVWWWELEKSTLQFASKSIGTLTACDHVELFQTQKFESFFLPTSYP